MLTEERYSLILKALKDNNSVTVTFISKQLGISESTVRRDFTQLAEMGKLVKVHGGAIGVEASYISMSAEPDVAQKQSVFSEEKTLIARYAAASINSNDFVFIDAGTTTGKMIDFITEKNAVFVTNGFSHARKLARMGLNAYLTGGKIKASTEAIVGVECAESLKKYNFTKCFLGANGISEQAGYTTHNIDEASIKKAASDNSYVTYILADHSKFGQIMPITFAEIKKGCIITDYVPDERYKDITIIKEVSV